MQKKIAVVGEKYSIMGFRAVGFKVFETSDAKTTTRLLEQLVAEDYGVVFITEQAMQPVIDVVDRYKEYQTPAIIPIPGRAGSLNIGMESVRKSVERAVGADILFKG